LNNLSPHGYAIIGTYELVPGTALATVTRETESLSFEYEGTTTLDWNDQKSQVSRGGVLYVDEGSNIWSEEEILSGRNTHDAEHLARLNEQKFKLLEACEQAEYWLSQPDQSIPPTSILQTLRTILQQINGSDWEPTTEPT
jgi:hypothetical protein